MAADIESTGLLDLTFDRVYREEQESIAQKLQSRVGGPSERPRFALAFSGGGTRAAAFQSGVLWRLAKSGRLKDVDYFSAVSGGAYITSAFASELNATPPPARSSEADQWYLNIVANAICRMQRNAGNFIRDPAQAGKSAWFDAPAAILMFFCTVLLNPAEILIVYLVPITECIQLFFGAALRAVVCNSTMGQSSWEILSQWSSVDILLSFTFFVVISTFVCWLLSTLRFFQPSKEEPTPQNPMPNKAYLWIQGCLAFGSRFSIVLILLIFLILSVPAAQVFSYGSSAILAETSQGAMCANYVAKMQAIEEGQDYPVIGMGCANFHNHQAWYDLDSSKVQPKVSTFQNTSFIHYQPKKEDLPVSNSVTSAFFGFLGTILVISGILVPVVPDIFLTILEFVGPAFVFVLIVLFLQFRTYGPITGQPLFFSSGYFDSTNWEYFVEICFLGSLLVVPFYNDLRRIFHWYYVRSLRRSWFHDGKDLSFKALAKHPYCPLVLYTGTVSDYIRPGSEESICEITFSPLHTGSDSTGYVRTPEYRTLAKCTALTAAGCLDAVALGLSNHLKFRFWLELLNLSWGDYILFIRSENRHCLRLAKWMSSTYEREILWALHRLPSLILWFGFMFLLFTGWSLSMRSGNQDCPAAKAAVLTAVFVAVVTIGLSFFCFVEPLDVLMFSPLIRQIHQASRYFFRGSKPPSLLYVSDGGVQDCTSIVQLMRRRCQRILLVLAADDPEDELGVFRTAMEMATAERLGSFYDPDDPKRDVRILLDEYQKDLEKPYLHLGIRYGWDGRQGEVVLGQLVVVKNRLPPSLAETPVLPLLTETEIVYGGVNHDGSSELKVSQLGGLGCSDCCHRNGCNCGTKFPHLTGANYLWLSPTLFGSLCRLGHDVSWEGIQRITK